MKRGLAILAVALLFAPRTGVIAGQAAPAPVDPGPRYTQNGKLKTISSSQAEIEFDDPGEKNVRTMAFVINGDTKGQNISAGQTVLVTYVKDHDTRVAIELKVVDSPTSPGTATPYGTASDAPQGTAEPNHGVESFADNDTPQGAPEPYEGLRSVADAADRNWREAHTALRRMVSGAAGPCDLRTAGALRKAQAALEERDRAWRELFVQRGLRKEDSRRAIASLQSQTSDELKLARSNLERLEGELADLKRRKADLEGGETSGLDPKDRRATSAELEELISVRVREISEGQAITANLLGILNMTQALQTNNDQTAATDSYLQLIDSQDKMYSGIYRARETELSLGCSGLDSASPPQP